MLHEVEIQCAAVPSGTGALEKFWGVERVVHLPVLTVSVAPMLVSLFSSFGTETCQRRWRKR